MSTGLENPEHQGGASWAGRTNARRPWDNLDWYQQILAASVLWAAFWLVVLWRAYPWLLGAVSS